MENCEKDSSGEIRWRLILAFVILMPVIFALLMCFAPWAEQNIGSLFFSKAGI